jgi:hypothetical protein
MRPSTEIIRLGYGALAKKKPPSTARAGLQALRSKGNAEIKARDKALLPYKNLSKRKSPPAASPKKASKKRKAKGEIVPYVVKQKGLQSPMSKERRQRAVSSKSSKKKKAKVPEGGTRGDAPQCFRGRLPPPPIWPETRFEEACLSKT